MQIKVLSLNCWFGRLKNELVEFLVAENPDIILLQEFPRSLNSEPDLLSELEKRLNLKAEYLPMWQFGENEGYLQGGLAVFSKFALKQVVKKYYFKNMINYLIEPGPGVNWTFPGAYIMITPDTSIGNISLVTTHFFWSLFPETTEEQKFALKIFLQEIKNEKNLILAGDFNVTPTSPIYETIREEFFDDNPEGLIRTIHPTIHRAGQNELVVDYFFHRGDNIRLLHSKQPDVGVSDHYPLVAIYEIS